MMLAELLRYVNLLVFLAGSLLYGYLAREVIFRPQILPGNRALRAVLSALAFFYLGTLIDEQIYLLHGLEMHSLAGTVWDLLRAAAWLLAFPLVPAVLNHSLRAFDYRPAEPWVIWPGRFTLLGFMVPAYGFFQAQAPLLAGATAGVYPWIVTHAAINLGAAGLLAGRLGQRVQSARAMSRMLLGLQAVFWGLAVFFVAGLWIDPWGEPQAQVSALQWITRTAVMASWLLPAALLATFVRRDHVLSLSLSLRTLRHFLGVLALVTLVMAAGPALGVVDVELYRRFVAWGLLLALGIGVFYRPVADFLFDRSRSLRRLLGRDLSAVELEDLVDRWAAFDGSSEHLTHQAGEQLSELLSLKVHLSSRDEANLEPLWRHFERSGSSRGEGGDERQGESRGRPDGDPHPPRLEAPREGSPRRRPVHRLDPVNGTLAALLAREELQAVFPLWVDGELAHLLCLGNQDGSPWGGSLADGELETVSLLIRQLSALLASRRRLENRLAEERRLAEQERLGLLGLVAASLAHEVKNPLSSMKVLAQALREDLASRNAEDEGVFDLDAILEQIDRLDLTTREILGIARPKVGARCRLADLVSGAVYVIGADAKRRGVTLSGEVADVGEVVGSPASWQTVVFNTILNAVQHTPAGDRVQVSLNVVEENGNWCFQVCNPVDPSTVVESDVDHWFEPFATDGGTGLGLALVARRAEELGVEPVVTLQAGQARFTVIGGVIEEEE